MVTQVGPGEHACACTCEELPSLGVYGDHTHMKTPEYYYAGEIHVTCAIREGSGPIVSVEHPLCLVWFAQTSS